MFDPQAGCDPRTDCEKQARVGAGGTNDDAALHKYFSYRESCYGRNVPDDRRQRVSAGQVQLPTASFEVVPVAPRVIQTERGVGYVFAVPVERV